MLRCRSWFAVIAFAFAWAPAARADKLVLFAGGGVDTENVPATRAKLNQPFGIDFDRAGNAYIVELAGGRVLKVNPDGLLTVVAGKSDKGDFGDGGPVRDAVFNGMHALAIPPGGSEIFIADTWNCRIRKINAAANSIATFAGVPYVDAKKQYVYEGDAGLALKAKFSGIYSLGFTESGNKMYVADLENRRVRVIDMKSGEVNLVAGNGEHGVPKDGADAKTAPLLDPRAAAVDKQGNVFILERGGHALRVVDALGKIRTVVGTGKAGLSGDGGDALKATLNGPKYLCIDRDGCVIIADSGNHVVRRYIPKDGSIVRIAGDGKKGASGIGGDPLKTAMNEPHGVCVHPDGTLYIVDSYNNRVFRLVK